MKKIIAVILSLVLMLGCIAGLAEKVELGTLNVNGEFKIQSAIPEGYNQPEIEDQTNTSIRAILQSDDATRPTVQISIVFADDWADTESLNDVSAEDLAAIEDSFREEDAVNIEYRESGHGTKLMVVTEAEGDIDFVDIYTIYKGYELEFVMVPGTRPLTEDSIQMLVEFMTEIDFIEV